MSTPAAWMHHAQRLLDVARLLFDAGHLDVALVQCYWSVFAAGEGLTVTGFNLVESRPVFSMHRTR